MLILNMLLSLLILFFILKTPVIAQNDFNINENIEYFVNSSGEALVTHQVDITNNFSQIYPKEYQLQIQGLPLSDLVATDESGNILQDLSVQNDITSLKLKFNQSKVGKGQTTSFKLVYRIANLAKHKGKTWEITLPQSIDSSPGNNHITLKTPSDFGSLSFSSVPINFEDGLTQNTTVIQNSSNNKILIIFGNYQLFNFELNYYLKNPSDKTIFSEVAIIPDTYSQSVFYQSIEPPPQGINVDADGNWLAKYQLAPHQELNIVAKGQVKTGLHLSNQILENFDPYLQDQQFWPVSDSQIQNLARTLSTPKTIYDYVVNNLSYNYDRLNYAGRQGAIAALINPSDSLCTEFTDLFVTLARAKGIPAREIEGFAYSNNPKIKPTNFTGDILHAWPEYYDTKANRWKAIDPTWGKTTNGIDYFNDLDLNHITFVTHGLNSQTPLAPGSYKKDFSEKSIKVDFATEEIEKENSFPVLSSKKKQIILNNSTPNSINSLQIYSDAINYQQKIENFLPYSSLSLSLPKISFWKSLSSRYQKITFTLKNTAGQTSVQSINYPQHFINLGITILAAILILSISGIIITSQTHEKNS